MTEGFHLTASEAQAKFNNGSLTVEDYAQSLLSRISCRDSTVHAWAYLNPDLVLKRARELDQTPHELRGPLHGVAIAVKDVILTKDMPTQYNSPIYVDHVTKVDAASIAILRAKGALIFGKFDTIIHKSSAATDIVNRQNYHHRVRCYIRRSCAPRP